MSFTVRTGRGTRPEATGGAIPAPSGGTRLVPYHGTNLGWESIRQGVHFCDERPLLAPKKKRIAFDALLRRDPESRRGSIPDAQ